MTLIKDIPNLVDLQTNDKVIIHDVSKVTEGLATVQEILDLADVPISSVNGQTGVVVLDADDISDATTTNKYTTTAEINKLSNIEALAEVNQTDSEIKTQYETNANTNVFTDAEKTKLLNVGVGADVVGPVSSTDNAITRFDTTTGKLLQNSNATLTDSGVLNLNNIPNVNNSLLDSMTTGVIKWDGATLGAGAVFTVGAGTAQFIDTNTDPLNPTVTTVSWAEDTGVVALNIATQLTGYVYIDNAGLIQQQNTKPTSQDYRNKIILHSWQTFDNINVSSIQDFTAVASGSAEALNDIIRAFGIVKDGAIVSPNGANLSIDLSSGSLFFQGLNYSTDSKSPSEALITGADLYPFIKGTQTGPTDAPPGVTVLDPLNYDLGGVITPIPGSVVQATNVRLYLFPSGALGALYGQVIYPTLDSAVQNADKESFIIPEFAKDQAILLAIISLRKDATDLSNTAHGRILPTSLFGEVGFGASGIPIGTLQEIINNSPQPQAVLTSALQLQTALASDSFVYFEGLNKAGTRTFSINGDGEIESNTLNISDASPVPSVDPVGGLTLYSETGSLKYRKPTGDIVDLSGTAGGITLQKIVNENNATGSTGSTVYFDNNQTDISITPTEVGTKLDVSFNLMMLVAVNGILDVIIKRNTPSTTTIKTFEAALWNPGSGPNISVPITFETTDTSLSTAVHTYSIEYKSTNGELVGFPNSANSQDYRSITERSA